MINNSTKNIIIHKHSINNVKNNIDNSDDDYDTKHDYINNDNYDNENDN